MSEVIYLLVEDTETDAWLVKVEMGRQPHTRLTWVRDGQEAVDYLLGERPYNNREQYPLPDVILLDLNMPRMDGFEFLEWRRTSAPRDLRIITVIVFSSSNLQYDVCRAYELGANRYMVKPLDLAAFRTQITLMVSVWGRSSELPHVADELRHSRSDSSFTTPAPSARLAARSH